MDAIRNLLADAEGTIPCIADYRCPVELPLELRRTLAQALLPQFHALMQGSLIRKLSITMMDIALQLFSLYTLISATQDPLAFVRLCWGIFIAMNGNFGYTTYYGSATHDYPDLLPLVRYMLRFFYMGFYPRRISRVYCELPIHYQDPPSVHSSQRSSASAFFLSTPFVPTSSASTQGGSGFFSAYRSCSVYCL